jgi:hypothetical protein
VTSAPSPKPLTPLAQALALWLGDARPAAPRACAPAEAIGRVLAEAVRAPGNAPLRPRARRAGFAVAASDTVGASPYAPAPCLAPPPFVAAGDPLPEGCDAVLPADALSDGPIPEIQAEVAPGTDVRRAGAEARAGETLIAAGRRLRASDAAALAALGVGTVSVRAPLVRLDGAAWLAPVVTALGGEVVSGEADLVLAVAPGDAAYPVDGPRSAPRRDHPARAGCRRRPRRAPPRGGERRPRRRPRAAAPGARRSGRRGASPGVARAPRRAADLHRRARRDRPSRTRRRRLRAARRRRPHPRDLRPRRRVRPSRAPKARAMRRARPSPRGGCHDEDRSRVLPGAGAVPDRPLARGGARALRRSAAPPPR